LGARTWGGILALWLAGLAVCISIFDLQRTVRARSRAMKEPPFVALVRLIRGNHRRYGGYLVHLGVVLMAVGIVGIEFFQAQTQVTISKTAPVTFDQFSIQFDGLKTTVVNDELQSTAAQLVVHQKNGTAIQLTPRVDQYSLQQQSVTIPGEFSTLVGDLYIVLVDWQPLSSAGATFRIYYNPLIDWFWIGTVVLVLGGLFAFWPEKSISKQRMAA
jgi:cytochrome c-type biogenesis protein CcmF